MTATLCTKSDNFSEANYDPRLSGGAATVFLTNAKAFGSAVPGLGAYDDFMHGLGDKIFNQTFVSAPAPLYGGLGPIYNNVSCVSCHHNDGKGTPTTGQITSSILTRISIPGSDVHGGSLPVEGFGLQLQDKAIAGKSPELKVNIQYSESLFTFPDGETVNLRKPIVSLENPYTPLPPEYLISVRLAPPIFGLGLLELVPESTILKLASDQAAENNGISGRPNYVFNSYTRKTELGRFGLKANNPNILMQVASAFHQDMGITSYLFPFESSVNQIQYDLRADDPEIADSVLLATSFYVQTLSVPARRSVEDPIALAGEKIFTQIKCASCHTPTLNTGVDVRIAALSNQRIHPYSDLLLHDMGDELSDKRSDFLATGNEWRTPPLWGIGLLLKVNGSEFFMHDGRARSIKEAILWHGGEAKISRDAYVSLSRSDRDALLKFIQSL